jgi:hypothetical protein
MLSATFIGVLSYCFVQILLAFVLNLPPEKRPAARGLICLAGLIIIGLCLMMVVAKSFEPVPRFP